MRSISFDVFLVQFFKIENNHGSFFCLFAIIFQRALQRPVKNPTEMNEWTRRRQSGFGSFIYLRQLTFQTCLYSFMLMGPNNCNSRIQIGKCSSSRVASIADRLAHYIRSWMMSKEMPSVFTHFLWWFSLFFSRPGSMPGVANYWRWSISPLKGDEFYRLLNEAVYIRLMTAQSVKANRRTKDLPFFRK